MARALGLVLCATDMAVALGAVLLAAWHDARHGGAWAPLCLWCVAAATPLITLATFSHRKLYDRALPFAPVRLWSAASAWLHVCCFVLVASWVAALLRASLDAWSAASALPSQFSGVAVIMIVAGGLGAVLAARLGLAALERRLIRSGRMVRSRVLVIGRGALASGLMSDLRRRAGSGVVLVGVLAEDAAPAAGAGSGMPVLGGIEDLAAVVERHLVDCVVIALPWTATSLVAEAIEAASLLPVELRLLPDPMLTPATAGPFARSNRLLLLREAPFSGSKALLKRAEDIVLASALLLVVSPVLLFCAVAIRLDSPGPVLFRQPRRGQSGRIFHIRKFRTMHADMTDLAAVRQTSRNDPRVTRVGAVLRRHSLDEVPQLIDVLLGSMSLVGPRPHPLGMRAEGMTLEEASAVYRARYQAKPGITGWAQINGWRGEVDSVEKLDLRVAHDLYYIDNWSLQLDLKILARTVPQIMRDTAAY